MLLLISNFQVLGKKEFHLVVFESKELFLWPVKRR